MRQHLYLGLMAIALAACAATPPKHGTAFDQISAELAEAAKQNARQPQPETVSNALLPPLKVDIPRSSAKSLEPKFDLVVNNAPATQVFMSLVTDTRYNMLVHPEVGGTISVNLKEVTLFEALNAIRELYGYEYKVEGTRIFIQPLSMQTRIYKVNYLIGRRSGSSDTRVHSGSVSNAPSPSTSTGTISTTSGATSSTQEGSTINTTTRNDFWADLEDSVRTVIGCKMPARSGSGSSTTGGGAQAGHSVETVSGRGVEGCDGGRSVVMNPQSGMVVVRAEPAKLRDVSAFLSASQISVERQVILEAKIIEVELSDGNQAGINWSALISNRLGGATTATSSSLLGLIPTLAYPANTEPVNTAGLFGLAFQTNKFAALIQFLETQGNVQVLSSPRIATLNNQKAVLKVGTDEFFVTNVTTTTTTGTATTSIPSVTLQPFFSGIALDVTPQIDENNNITLHIHPTVSKVTTVNKIVDFGSGGSMNLPLASSNVSETDSIVRARDGQIVAIGGLMKISMTEDRGEVPGLGGAPMVGPLFRNTKQAAIKKELVILLKPTVIEGDSSWNLDIQDTQQRIQKMDRGFSYGGRSEVFGVGAESR